MGNTYKDRVRETTTTTGTGTLTLAGAVTQYQGFESIGDAATCRYTLLDANGVNWEVGTGTYTLATNTLARDTIHDSDNGGSKITLTSGTHTVFLTPDSTALPFKDALNTWTATQTIDILSPLTNDEYGWLITVKGEDSTAAATTGIYAEGQTASTSTVNIGQVYGGNFAASAFNGSGRTCTDVVGVVGQAAKFGLGTVTNCTGFLTSVRNEANGSLVNAHGVLVQAIQNTAAGTITNAYGVKVENISTGVSINYALFTGTGYNYFGDRLTWVPPASVTPSNNGDLTFEATSNTTITVKYKGSDGTVRSGTITLS